ncbi:hypothetical protein M0R01_02045 [bacterium]|nr:hypothetical protein [bacterium]
MSICERFKDSSLISLQDELERLPCFEQLLKYIADMKNNIDGKIEGFSFFLKTSDNLHRNLLCIFDNENTIIIIYNKRFEILSVEYYSGSIEKCREMLSISERLIFTSLL